MSNQKSFFILGPQQFQCQEAWTLYAAGGLSLWLSEQIYERRGPLAGRPEQCGELSAWEVRHSEILQKGRFGHLMEGSIEKCQI